MLYSGRPILVSNFLSHQAVMTYQSPVSALRGRSLPQRSPPTRLSLSLAKTILILTLTLTLTLTLALVLVLAKPALSLGDDALAISAVLVLAEAALEPLLALVVLALREAAFLTLILAVTALVSLVILPVLAILILSETAVLPRAILNLALGYHGPDSRLES